MKDINLKFDISLQKFSALCLAEALWETPIIQNEIKKYASNYNQKNTLRNNEENWRKISEKLIHVMKCLPLPKKLSRELENAVIFIGDRVFFWFIHVITELAYDLKYFQKIHWTSFGIVDDWKIYEDWRKDPMFPDLPEAYKNKFVLYCTACTYADENLIRQSLLEIARLIGMFIGINIKDLSRFKVNSAMSIMLIWYISKMKKGLDFNTIYSNLKSPEYPTGTDKLFLSCTSLGLIRSAEYFYKKLKEKDKQRLVNQAVLDCLSNLLLNPRLNNPVMERIPELLLYLLNKMPTEQKRALLLEKIAEVYGIFLLTWPYQQLCTPLLDYVWDDVPKQQKLSLLEINLTILNHFSKDRHAAYKLTIHQPILMNLMSRVPKDLKQNFFCKSDAIFELFQISDYSTIDIILNDKDLKPVRFNLIDISDYLNNFFEEGGSSKNVKEYMTNLHLSKEEKRNLLRFTRNNPYLLNMLVSFGRLDDAEDVLEWECDSNEKKILEAKKDIRQQFDSVFMCSDFIDQGKPETVEKYLKWLYKDDDKDLDSITKKLFSTDFIRDKVWFLWISNRKESLKSAQKICSKFLKHCNFKTDHEIEIFKKEKLIEDVNFIKFFFDAAKNVPINFAEIFEFCAVSTEKVKEIKQKIRSTIYWWVTSYGGNPNQFLALNSLVNWIVENEKQKEIIISKHINSSQGAALCFVFSKYCGVSYNAYKEARKILFLEWVKPYGDVDRIKNLLDEAGRNDNVTEIDVQKVFKLLDLCKSGSVNLLLQALDH